MDSREIYERVSIEFKRWNDLQRRMGWETEISEGAVEALSQMVINIKEDPSSSWVGIIPEETQEYAISVIPNILNEIFLRFQRRRGPRQLGKITSWEIWHGISSALDSWCPINKDF